MIRRSGVSPAVNRSKFWREMLRRAASGHIAATQLSKLAAAWRIAAAVIRGWPEAPSSPLQGCGPPFWAGCAGLPGPEKILPKMFGKPLEDWAWAESGRSATPDSARLARIFRPLVGRIICSGSKLAVEDASSGLPIV